MSMRWPLFPTIVVALAVATMIGLGVWQLQRKDQKEALIALYSANSQKAAIAFPRISPLRPIEMFRKSSVNCMEVTGWQSGSGRDDKGKPGIKFIAECRTGAEGPGVLVALGVADRPDAQPNWRGGFLSGTVNSEPDRYSFLEKLLGQAPPLRPMLVADEAPAGLRPVAKPSPKEVTNNHLSYAVQWFIFAAAAAVIYVLALRKRQRP
jgi:surfeit locus 1 family protein